MVVIVDFGAGNVGSIANILTKVGATPVVANDSETVAAAPAIILPGVGSFDDGIRALRATGLVPALAERVAAGVPLLGICLGMQMLCRRSEEGVEAGLGWLEADVVRVRPTDPALPVPHVGWTPVTTVRPCPLFDTLEEPEFYFLHSYEVRCDDPALVTATCEYGGERVAAVRSDNLFGVQFHPEKSHAAGIAVFRSFVQVAAAGSARVR
jgi:imidazole glycerol-phosphate synthase subunit HisH